METATVCSKVGRWVLVVGARVVVVLYVVVVVRAVVVVGLGVCTVFCWLWLTTYCLLRLASPENNFVLTQLVRVIEMARENCANLFRHAADEKPIRLRRRSLTFCSRNSIRFGKGQNYRFRSIKLRLRNRHRPNRRRFELLDRTPCRWDTEI